MADYCVYWITRANDHLPTCTKLDPFAGGAGLVGTQNIRNNQSRVGGLDRVVATGTIIDAVDNQPWSGEANVHVSIANWIKTQEPSLVPKTRRLWSQVERAKGGKKVKRGERADKTFELAERRSATISAVLSDAADTTGIAALECNTALQCGFQGVVLGYSGFVLDDASAAELLKRDIKLRELVRPYLVGDDIVASLEGATRSVIDFANRPQLEAQKFKAAWDHIVEHVLPEVRSKARGAASSDMGKARADHLERWWQFWNVRVELRERLRAIHRYIALPRVTKRQIVVFASSKVVPDCQVQVFTFEDDYSFGILAGRAHWQWFVTRSSKLTERLRYSRREVFDTFPWPQSPTKAQIDAVAEAGRRVRSVRAEALKVIDGGLRAVYRTLELPGKHPLKDAHAALDAAVLAAYGFSAEADLLKQLLDLNHAIAAKEKVGEPVTPPGVPASYGDPTPLITDDCIRPREDT